MSQARSDYFNNLIATTPLKWATSNHEHERGSVGPTGPEGPQGPPGTDGVNGVNGVDGATGPAGPGVPVGGTAGQVLKKINATDYNTEWATPAAGGEAFPVGAVFIAVVSTNPATLLGYGTWSAFAAGRMLVGLDSGDADFDLVEEIGGAKTVTLTESQIPSHTHTQNSHNHTQDAHSHVQQRHATTTGALTGITTAPDTSSSAPGTLGPNTATTVATNQAATATNQNTGGGGSHNNLPPYIVTYMWKRTA